MSGSVSEQAGTIGELLANLRANASHEMLTALARELSNHIYLTGKFGLSANGECRATDVQMILDRWDLVLRTIQPSERGPEAFRPPPRPLPDVPRGRPFPDLTRLESDLRAPSEVSRRVG